RERESSPSASSHTGRPEVQVAAQHAAKVSHVCDATAGSENGGEESDSPQHHHEILRGDRKDQEVNDSIRKQDSIGQENSVKCAGSSDGGHMRVAPGEQEKKHHHESCPDSTHEEKPRELPGAPNLLQLGTEHPESEHIEKNVEDVSGVVEKDVGDQL